MLESLFGSNMAAQANPAAAQQMANGFTSMFSGLVDKYGAPGAKDYLATNLPSLFGSGQAAAHADNGLANLYGGAATSAPLAGGGGWSDPANLNVVWPSQDQWAAAAQRQQQQQTIEGPQPQQSQPAVQDNQLVNLFTRYPQALTSFSQGNPYEVY